MKKLTILAAALAFAGTANAQYAPSSIGSAPGANSLSTIYTETVVNSTYTRQISDIQQAGTNQYGTLDQSGGQNAIGLQNTATLTQVSSTGGYNNASQTQVNDASQGASTSTAMNRHENRMEATQSGDYGMVSQSQQGQGNNATALQATGSYRNDLTQTQLGSENNAYTEQRGAESVAMQDQSGARNAGVVIQTSPSSHNRAEQSQSGDDNQAYVGQGTIGGGSANFGSGYNTSYQTQSGASNYVTSNQFGSDDFLTVHQSGTSNTAVTVQH